LGLGVGVARGGGSSLFVFCCDAVGCGEGFSRWFVFLLGVGLGVSSSSPCVLSFACVFELLLLFELVLTGVEAPVF
jgi:hypothetical protein